jgi:uncharacterized protein YndB with AHSA1/START domain
MTGERHNSERLLGTLSTADGKGVVTMRDRFSTDIEDLWSALTDPDRLARWLGEFDGELRLGGHYRAHYHASGWEGTCTVTECDPPHHLVVTSDDGGRTEVTLTADGDGTLMVAEERGMPADLLFAYGAGIQVHMEDLIAHIAGSGRVPAARWEQLEPLYREIAPVPQR